MNLWRIQNLLTKVPNIIRRSQTRKVLQENWVTRVFHQHQSLRDLRQAPIAGVLWPSDSVTNEFRCALRSVPSHNLVNLTTYTGDVGKTAGFLRCPSTFRIDSGQNSRLPSASQPAEVRRLPASTDNPEVGVDLYAMEDPQNGLVLPLEAPVGVRTVVSFGKAAGQYAVAVQRQSGASQKVHFACSSYSEDGNFSERAICERSDLVFGVGGGVTDNARCCRPGGAHLFTPGIIRDFCTCKQREDEPGKFRVVVFYPSLSVLGSGDEAHVIPAKAVSDLSALGSPCNLIAICAPGDDPEKLKNTLKQQGINRSRFVVRRHCRDLEARKRLLVEADLLIMPFLPSESESFGLVALQAMSAGLPILITRESGLGEALGEVLHGRVCLVEEGAGLEDWKKRIQLVRRTKRDMRLQEAEKIRDAYSEHYSWNVECKAVLDKICSNLTVR